MSGINFLLDTLLHQVLGKRVDTASTERQPAPVKPLAPTDAVQQLRSDSRLNQQRGTPVFAGALSTSVIPAAGQDGTSSRHSLSSSGNPDVRTHLSAAARTLSDLLSRTSDPAPTIRPRAPLAENPTVNAQVLAANFQASVEFSGLFYESHVLRWYQGERERAQLEAEPQMRSANTATGSGTTVEKEALQALVRQQLELIPAQQLRWEGQLWPGMPLEMCIKISRENDGQADSFPGEALSDDADEIHGRRWEVRLQLAHPDFGDMSVDLLMVNENLSVAVTVTPEAVDTVDGQSDVLRRQFEMLGFHTLKLDIEPVR